MENALIAGDVSVVGHGGDEIPAYAALPQSDRPVGGVVVIHHMPGFDWATKEIVRRFAAWGFPAVCPNLHHREAPGADADDAAAANRAAGGVPDERLLGDLAGAREFLLGQPASNGRTGVIGFCSGGRQAVLAGCSLPFDAAVDCYGAFVLSSPAEGSLTVRPLTDRLGDLGCPLLGLFGNDDSHPSPDEVDELDARLTALGKPHDFHRFDGAGHGFFAIERAGYRAEVAGRAWPIVREFFAAQLAGQHSAENGARHGAIGG
jgi:carboxymethylenebutenolidase